jgi:hypothetical protein
MSVGKEEEVLRKRVAVLVAAAMMVLSMLAVSALVFAQECPGGELKPGQSGERARSPHTAPSEGKPGSLHRSASGDEHDTSDDLTGRGELCGEI